MIQELLEQQKIKLPLTQLHNRFGICFDKKDTYTITELDKEDFKGTITINNVIKTAGVDLSKDTEVVVIFSYKNLNYVNGIATCSFNINKEKKTVNSYTNVYNKGDIIKELREAIKVVVIEATRESLKFPKYTCTGDRESRKGSDFLNDRNPYERVRFNDYKYVYNEELDKTERLLRTDEEVRSLSVRDDIDVQSLITGQKMNLYSHLYIDYFNYFPSYMNGVTWGDFIDKSGYNVGSKRSYLMGRLETYKADKVRKRIKGGDLISTQADVIAKIKDCKISIGNALLTHPSTLDELTKQIESAEDKLNDLRWIILNFKRINERVNDVIAGEDYNRYTLNIEGDLKDIQDKLSKILNEG